jgi:hypothetical protein
MILGTSLFSEPNLAVALMGRCFILAACGKPLAFPTAIFTTPEKELIGDRDCFDSHDSFGQQQATVAGSFSRHLAGGSSLTSGEG